MIVASLPSDEDDRLVALDSYRVLDTPPEPDFDDLTALAAFICETPIALVSLIDARRQWFKSHHGLNARETPRDIAFCAHAILHEEIMVVPDANLDPRFHDNPLNTGEPHVRFYAGTPLIDPDGHALGTLCVIDHVPRELSAAQLAALASLGRQVICQLELRRARDEALSAARAKTEFLATMSHEIRTPLNGVLGMSQLLGDTAVSAEQRDLVTVIQQSGEHLLGVVNDILDFSRLDSGRMQLEQAEFNLHELVVSVIATHAQAAQRKGLALNLEWNSTLTSQRMGDAHRIRQLLTNLIGNAIKFTSHGSVTVQVQDAAPAPRVRLAVIDTGIGISKKLMPRLFQRFTQADSSTTRPYGGAGLGLAIARQLVELMNGELKADSEPEKGSRFWFTLPLALAEGRVAHEAVNTEPCDLGGRSLLVVEDDAVDLMLITKLLSACNCRIAVARTGVAALELCRRQVFDLILMDGLMPEMDGYDATQRIRALPVNWVKAVPIIALTADVLNGDRERCMAAGMSHYLSKPVQRTQLYATLTDAARMSGAFAITHVHSA